MIVHGRGGCQPDAGLYCMSPNHRCRPPPQHKTTAEVLHGSRLGAEHGGCVVPRKPLAAVYTSPHLYPHIYRRKAAATTSSGGAVVLYRTTSGLMRTPAGWRGVPAGVIKSTGRSNLSCHRVARRVFRSLVGLGVIWVAACEGVYGKLFGGAACKGTRPGNTGGVCTGQQGCGRSSLAPQWRSTTHPGIQRYSDREQQRVASLPKNSISFKS